MTKSQLQLEARLVDGKAMRIAGLRAHFNTANWQDIPLLWQRLMSHGKLAGQIENVYYGLCFNMSDGVDYLAGAEVSGTAALAAELTSVNVPAQKYVVFQHGEHVAKLYNTMEAIWRQWFPASGYEVAPPPPGAPSFFERYGEGFDPQTGMGDVEVWIPIKS